MLVSRGGNERAQASAVERRAVDFFGCGFPPLFRHPSLRGLPAVRISGSNGPRSSAPARSNRSRRAPLGSDVPRNQPNVAPVASPQAKTHSRRRKAREPHRAGETVPWSSCGADVGEIYGVGAAVRLMWVRSMGRS